MPRAAPPKLERGDYPLLTDDDLQDVMLQVRSWSDYIPEHPSVASARDEEPLRDSLLHSLNSRWRGTAETFSQSGKTDIRVLVNTADVTGSSDAVFKAECKIYKDAGDVTEAFEQLTKRYLTLRESRTAVVLFVRDRKLFPKVRARAVKRLTERHGGKQVAEVAGWPTLDLPHPDDAERTVRVVVAIIDVSKP